MLLFNDEKFKYSNNIHNAGDSCLLEFLMLDVDYGKMLWCNDFRRSLVD